MHQLPLTFRKPFEFFRPGLFASQLEYQSTFPVIVKRKMLNRGFKKARYKQENLKFTSFCLIISYSSFNVLEIACFKSGILRAYALNTIFCIIKHPSPGVRVAPGRPSVAKSDRGPPGHLERGAGYVFYYCFASRVCMCMCVDN